MRRARIRGTTRLSWSTMKVRKLELTGICERSEERGLAATCRMRPAEGHHDLESHVVRDVRLLRTLRTSTTIYPRDAQPDSLQRGSCATVTVGTAVARRGQVAYGALRIAAAVDSATSLPVAVVNGARSGPVIALVAGSHGTEYTSIVALGRLIGQPDPRGNPGTGNRAPLLNGASFTQMTVHLNPIDGKGMNAQYPGDPAGSQTQRALTRVAAEVVQPADLVIDLHGGDLDEDLRPYSYWFRGGRPAQDSASRALALAFGLDHIIVRDFVPGDPASRRNLGGHAMSLGKTVLVAEAGRSGTVAPDELQLLIDGVLNVMGALRMIDRPVRPVERPVWLDASTRIAADSAGMFFATVGR